jgi:hypothetical protein
MEVQPQPANAEALIARLCQRPQRRRALAGRFFDTAAGADIAVSEERIAVDLL